MQKTFEEPITVLQRLPKNICLSTGIDSKMPHIRGLAILACRSYVLAPETHVSSYDALDIASGITL